MYRYFVDGKEITESEATVIKKKNIEIINSGNFARLAEVKFVVKIKK